ncbi:allophanate hydrolase subunit 1 [Frankia sp. AgB32]|uniref:allophanate hydrolase subunit 1 n=1 Tax=Frankia sp. AgB32 TaxID=631119 RepID=UPI0034D3A5A9
MRHDPPRGLVELVPAARTVLVQFDRTATDAGRLREHLRADAARAGDEDPAAPPATPGSGPAVTVRVRYDGPDLADVAELTGLTPRQVVERHTGSAHRVAFCGFAPGFAYIAGLDPGLRVPRRDTPRARVPAGAVALADLFTGVYPRASPGGWHLIGHTDLVAFDLDRDPPALLAPGTPVHFVETGTPETGTPETGTPETETSEPGRSGAGHE